MAKFYYGGQAVMEGVMMRGRISAAVAVRRPDQSIYLYEEALNPRLYQNPLFRLPFLRGLLLLWEMLVLGTRLMTFSANIATGAINPDAPLLSPDTADPAARNEKRILVWLLVAMLLLWDDGRIVHLDASPLVKIPDPRTHRPNIG